MEQTSLSVRNPFALRESLQIALEVVWQDLPPKLVPRLRSFVHRLPNSTLPQEISLGEEERHGLRRCAALFRQSRTSHWLRVDMNQVISEMEQALQ